MDTVSYPFDSDKILRRKKSLRRQLLEQPALIEKRVAILCGSTIGDIKDVLEIFLLSFGFRPEFYVGQYNRFYEEIMFENQELRDFKPDLIYIHTSTRNLSDNATMDKLQTAWAKIKSDFSCPIIQNNFELPTCGSELDIRKTNELNIQIADYAEQNLDFHINDIQYLSACFGLDNWFDEQDYFLYKYALSINAIPTLCYNIAKIIKSIYGKNKKCLVLDLDNTLWGGVVGDVGIMGIELGMETALGEAFVAFQKYVKSLRDKGIILAVCSKNDEHIAKDAFNNPNMFLKLEDITVFCANWNSKADNIVNIARQLNILTESIVFIDDNPAERELIRQSLPEVEVPDVSSPVDFVRYIENAGYFYAVNISDEDRKRNEYYLADVKRNEVKAAYLNYGDYLRSLEMSAKICSFDPVHLERVTQLINKTNQFNLTTRRYSQSEIERISGDQNYITYYATLDDRFGSNGIVSVFIGEIEKRTLHIRLWVMSCRVFKRDLELAIFDQLAESCMSRGIERIVGYYYRTEKNAYVANLLDDLGFVKIGENEWEYNLAGGYEQKNIHISVKGDDV